jgi:hypothetical protein
MKQPYFEVTGNIQFNQLLKSPSEWRTFVSMDVTFRESELFYGEKADLSLLFDFTLPAWVMLSRVGESEPLGRRKMNH